MIRPTARPETFAAHGHGVAQASDAARMKVGLGLSALAHMGVVAALIVGIPAEVPAEKEPEIIAVSIAEEPQTLAKTIVPAQAPAIAQTPEPEQKPAMPAPSRAAAKSVPRPASPQGNMPVSIADAPAAEMAAAPVTPSAPAAEPAGETVALAPSQAGSASKAATTGHAGSEKEAPSALAGNPRPSYPPRARREGLEGDVMLRLSITPEGAVAGIEILRSSGAQILDRAARETIERWRFRPALVNGVAVSATVDVPVRFRLTD